jgi:hypothetical protein
VAGAQARKEKNATASHESKTIAATDLARQNAFLWSRAFRAKAKE